MEKDNTSRDKKNTIAKEILQWVQTILIAAVIALIIRGFVFERAIVDGSSMEDTLYNRQNLIIYKLGYYFHQPKHGDIITLKYQEGTFKMKFFPFSNPNEVDYVKRVIGLPGDNIDIKNENVYVNGVKLQEPYAKGLTNTGSKFNYPIKVPPNKVFVLGDNREVSKDSREIDFIDISKIRGKAIFRLWPLNKFGGIYDNLR